MEVTDSADASVPSAEGPASARWRPLLPVLLALGGGGLAEAGSLANAPHGRAAAPVKQHSVQQQPGYERRGLLDEVVTEGDRDRVLGLRGGGLLSSVWPTEDARAFISSWWSGKKTEEPNPELHWNDDFQEIVCGPLQCADATTTALVDLLSPLLGDGLAMELGTHVNS